VVAVGTCAASGGVFDGLYNVEGGIDSVIPVHAYIPGCPASPEAIVDGVVKLLSALENGQAGPVERPRVEFDNIREMESLIAPEKLVRSKEESASDAQ
jgi:Ni,Fe-hydrogenase III small subunit